MKKWKVDNVLIKINTTSNNTILTVTTPEGKVMFWESPGKLKFKGKRKSGFLPAQLVAKEAANKLKSLNISRIKLIACGPGAALVPVAKVMEERGLEIVNLAYADRFPHNGCRPRKKRRV